MTNVAIRIDVSGEPGIRVVNVKLDHRGAKCKYLWQALCKLVQIYKAFSHLKKVSLLATACLLKILEHQNLLKGFAFVKGATTRHFSPEGD